MKEVHNSLSAEDKSLACMLALGGATVGLFAVAPAVPLSSVVYTVWRYTGRYIPYWVGAALIAAAAASVAITIMCAWTGIGVAAAGTLVKIIWTIGSVSG